MNKTLLIGSTLAAISGFASAVVTSYTPASLGAATHNSGLYSTNASAPLFNWNAPYTTTSLLLGFWETRARMRTTIPIATPTHVRMEGDYFGFAAITYNGAGLANFLGGSVSASGELTFTVNTPSTVTISSTNTFLNVNNVGHLTFTETYGRLRFQGIDYTSNAVDASFTFNVGPGTYSAQFLASTAAAVYGYPNSQAFADHFQKYRIDVISPVPEPATMVAVGLGILGLRARRRR